MSTLTIITNDESIKDLLLRDKFKLGSLSLFGKSWFDTNFTINEYNGRIDASFSFEENDGLEFLENKTEDIGDNTVVDLGKDKTFPVNGEMTVRINDILDEYAGRMSTAEAIGILDIIKNRLLNGERNG